MPTNFELERLKLKLDIFKIPGNRVHELTDSKGPPTLRRYNSIAVLNTLRQL